MDELYTAQEAYDLGLVRVKPRTLMEYARTRRINSTKDGRTVLFSKEDIADYRASCRRVSAPEPTRSPKYAGRN